MQKSLWVYTVKMLYKGLKSLNKLNIIKEAERLAIAKALAPTSNFNFLKILLNPIVEATF
jgi:hypothetical protein